MYNYSTIGVLFFFTFFFLIFWLLARKELLMLFFALTALGILMRSVNTGLYFSNAFVYTPWNWQIRMEYTGTYIAHIFGMICLHMIFPARYMRWPIRVNTVLFSLAVASLFLLPVHLFTYEMWLFQPLLILFMAHYLIVSLMGTFRGRAVDAIFFVSLAFFLYTLINDILLANSAGAIYNNYFSQISFQLFIFAMAVLVILQWVNNYNERFKLESSLRFKNKVLSVIAHDLKNPVASIAQFSDLLANKPEIAGTVRFTRSLQESSQAAVTLLDNLLYWGRSQADELKISAAPFKVDQLLREVTSLYRHMATQKEIDLKSETPPDLEVIADRALINIVVRNLVSNAIKFTPRKGTVHLVAERLGSRVLFRVSDTGVGMSPEVLASLKQFGQLDSTAGTDQEIGTGLGLQLVRDLVEKNGGTLSVESTPGKGSVFTFTLPTKI
jgi:signal transduction histidine kinase